MIISAIRKRARNGNTPLVVSLDGRSGVGKSTLASLVAESIDTSIVPIDEFYAGSIPDADWVRMTAQQRWANVFCWQRIRSDVIEPMISGRPARWFQLDFDAGPLTDGTYLLKSLPTELAPFPVIILDGVYTSGPQLADLVDFTVLVEVPEGERRSRLGKREEAAFLAHWHRRWDAVEDFYFSQIRPRNSFDLIVTT